MTLNFPFDPNVFMSAKLPLTAEPEVPVAFDSPSGGA